MTFRNLTPHRIVIRPDDGKEVVIEPSGLEARVIGESVCISAPSVGGIPTSYCGGGRVDLPPALPGIIDLVSRLALERLTADQLDGRQVAAPDTGPRSAIRNAEGQIEAVKRLLLTRVGDLPHALWRVLHGHEFGGWVCVGTFPTRDKAFLERADQGRGMRPLGPRIDGDAWWGKESLILPLGVTPAFDAKGDE